MDSPEGRRGRREVGRRRVEDRSLAMGRFVWLEAVLPLGIIAGMLCVMGNAQYYIHKAAHGRVRRCIVYSPFLGGILPFEWWRCPCCWVSDHRMSFFAAEAHRKWHLGCGHGEAGQEDHGNWELGQIWELRFPFVRLLMCVLFSGFIGECVWRPLS